MLGVCLSFQKGLSYEETLHRIITSGGMTALALSPVSPIWMLGGKLLAGYIKGFFAISIYLIVAMILNPGITPDYSVLLLILFLFYTPVFILGLFRQRGIEVTEIYPNVTINKKGMRDVEIDLLLASFDYSVAVEVKTTLKVADVNEHLRRLEKLKKNPIRLIKGTTLLGAVAGMRILENADRYAYRKGLFVLKQKGEIVHIANDSKFRPREWAVM